MSVNLNQVTFAGNLTRDPESREIGEKTVVVHFTLANNRRYKTSEGEAREEVTFLDVEAWGRTAELVIRYLTKGQSALVTGRLKQEQWQDKDGNKRSRIKIVADQIHFLSRPGAERPDDVAGPSEDTPPPAARPRPATGAGSRTAARAMDEAPF